MIPSLIKKTKKWEASEPDDGVVSYRLASWKYFPDFVQTEMLDYRTYIWRGHRNSNWLLEPTLDRTLKTLPPRKRTRRHSEHLEAFMYATRGRRGTSPPSMKGENEWWALGQHNGLFTPLLDWTTSPFVAAFFAFVEIDEDQTDDRAVFAVSRNAIKRKSEEIKSDYKGSTRPPIVEFVRPLSDENSRLVSQAGLFTRSPDCVDLETWVRQNYAGEKETQYLLKITIPDKDRELALRSLNRMNINHLTLFPDLYGACSFCNMEFAIQKY